MGTVRARGDGGCYERADLRRRDVTTAALMGVDMRRSFPVPPALLLGTLRFGEPWRSMDPRPGSVKWLRGGRSVSPPCADVGARMFI